ncbi:MAG: hypothetical protein DHS20C21_04210 [Gemmatimonadota bacterium]|nr:MAG: hypothetical protein DHS20C21_04210 [Gemmatimonadota bacterium]
MYRLAELQISGEELALYVLAFGALGHHLPGMMRAYGDRDLFQRFRTRFVLAPVFIGAVCVSFTLWNLSAIVLAVYLWGAWHGMMQSYGFVRIYDGKGGVFDRWTQKLDFAMCAAWFGAGVVLSPARFFKILDLFHVRAGAPIPSGEVMHGFQALWAAGTAVITVLFLANLVRNVRAKRPIPWIKLTVLATSIGLWWYSNVATLNMLVGLALFEVFHDVQYLSIVWIFNRAQVEKNPGTGGLTGWLFRRSGILVGLYVGLVFAYGSIRFVANGISSETLRAAMEGLIVGSAILHFYYDGFIWKIRETKTRQKMGLDGGNAHPTGKAEGMPPWMVHAGKWGLAVVPLVALGMAEPARRPGVFLRTEALAAQLPENPFAQKTCGDAFREVGRDRDALAKYRLASQLGLDSAELHHNTGVLLVRTGDGDAARSEFEAALAKRALPESHVQLGNLAFAANLRDDARDHWQTALRLDSRCAEAHHGMGRYFTTAGALSDAVTSYQRAIECDPATASTRFNLGAVLEALQQPADALAAYQAALAIDPGLEPARARVAVLRSP